MTVTTSPGSAWHDRLQAQLAESYNTLWQSFVDPAEAYASADGDGAWPQVGAGLGLGIGQHSPHLNEGQLREARTACRSLATHNEFAINGHENRVSYIVGAGHVYRATPKKGRDGVAELAEMVQQAIDEFLRINAWRRRQAETVRRKDRDGEVFLRLFADHDGATRIRFVEPEQVATPTDRLGDASAALGLLTDRHDVETVLAYYIDGQPVDADEIQHRKAHVDSNVRRGLPLFLPVLKNLRRAEKLLRNMSAVANVQSAIALIRKHRAASKSSVQQFVATDQSAVRQRTGEPINLKHYGPGTILDAPSGMEYEFPASGLDAGAFVTVLQAELRAIASRLVMPEFMLTSDASNANYASTMVAEGPAMKMFQRLQAEQIADDLELIRRAITNLVAAGRLPAESLTSIEIQAWPPSLAVRDVLAEAQAFRIEFESGILSPQTWSQRRGLDYDQEQHNLAQHSEEIEGGRK